MSRIASLVLIPVLRVVACLAVAAVAVHAAPFAYLSKGDAIEVTDIASGAVVATVPVPKAGTTLAAAPDGKTVFAVSLTQGYSGAIVAIDTATHTVRGTIPISGLPWDMEVNPASTRLYVTLNADEQVAVIDTSTLSILARVSIISTWHDSPSGLGLSADGRSLYVAHHGWGGGYNRVSVIDTGSMETSSPRITPIVVGIGPLEVVTNPVLPRAYVTQFGYFGDGSTVTVVDTQTNEAVATIPVGRTPAGATVSDDGKRLYVGNYYDDSVSVIDTATHTVVATVRVGRAPYGMNLDRSQGRLYVANSDATLSILNTQQPAVIRTIAAGQPDVTAFGQFVTGFQRDRSRSVYKPVENDGASDRVGAAASVP